MVALNQPHQPLPSSCNDTVSDFSFCEVSAVSNDDDEVTHNDNRNSPHHHTQETPSVTMRLFWGATALVVLSGSLAVEALKFDISAVRKSQSKPRCVRNYVSRDTLVVVTAKSSGTKGDGQTLNIHVFPPTTVGPGRCVCADPGV